MNCFIVCLCGCGIQDFRSRRISNFWIICGLVVGSICHGGRFWLSVAGLLLFLGWLYFFRMIGAGDLKLMALICGFMGLSRGICAIGLACCICGLRTLAGIFFHYGSGQQLRMRLSYFFAWSGHFIQTKERIAYYDRERDGLSVSIPLGSYLCAGTLCYLAMCSWKGGL